MSYESDDSETAELNELNPKLGVQWAINDQVSLRAAAFKKVKWAFTVDQTIEPTQVAGFNQLIDDREMTVSKNYGAGLDIRFNDQLFGGLEALKRDAQIPFGTLDVPEFYVIENSQEYFYRAYLYWLPSPRWSVTASWLYQTFENDCTLCQLFNSIPAQLNTLSLPVNVQYFSPSGFFAGLGLIYVNQDIQSLDPASSTALPTQNEDFTLVNAGLGYRFPKRWGIIALQANNLFDRKFHFQDYSFQNGDGTVNPLYFPERTIISRLVLNF